mmetsp:Transcript_77259/g.213692  ORF Transcript_77259/g.213692 Transcript_77259/m.213692 type:complete len:303 (+) Transcript_77259:1292-2200(+)
MAPPRGPTRSSRACPSPRPRALGLRGVAGQPRPGWQAPRGPRRRWRQHARLHHRCAEAAARRAPPHPVWLEPLQPQSLPHPLGCPRPRASVEAARLRAGRGRGARVAAAQGSCRTFQSSSRGGLPLAPCRRTRMAQPSQATSGLSPGRRTGPNSRSRRGRRHRRRRCCWTPRHARTSRARVRRCTAARRRRSIPRPSWRPPPRWPPRPWPPRPSLRQPRRPSRQMRPAPSTMRRTHGQCRPRPTTLQSFSVSSPRPASCHNHLCCRLVVVGLAGVALGWTPGRPGSQRHWRRRPRQRWTYPR